MAISARTRTPGGWLLLAVLAIICSVTAGPAAAGRIALVIGNGDYQGSMPSIRGPVNDGVGMAEALRDIGYDVVMGVNLGAEAMRQRLKEFSRRLQPNDEALVYYSGHGVQIDGQNYLIPVDTRAKFIEDLRGQAPALDDVLSIMRRSGATTSIVILDACRDSGLPSRRGVAVRGLATPDVPAHSLIAYATRPNDIARGALDQYSIYTSHLIERIREPGQLITSLFENVRNAVIEITRADQVPVEWTSLRREVRLVEGYCPAQTEFVEPDCKGCPVMVNVPPGSFVMGSDNGPRESRPTRLIDVDGENRFAIGKFEVTFDEWEACTDCRRTPDDEGFGEGRRPVINVEWEDAQRYVRWLARRTGKPYMLPSEAQWEYAARGGTTKKFWWGDDRPSGRANCDGCGSEWDGKGTAPVGSFPPNPFGLHDVHGNVFEWVQDCWHDSYVGAPGDLKPRLDGLCGMTVLRGGSWRYGATAAHVFARGKSGSGRRDDFGFRVALQCSG